MHQQVGLAYLVECGFERFDELGGELANEADGVGEEVGQPALCGDAAHSGV